MAHVLFVFFTKKKNQNEKKTQRRETQNFTLLTQKKKHKESLSNIKKSHLKGSINIFQMVFVLHISFTYFTVL